ncbi:hypothetical protein [Phreatobacter sp.]|uniref:hypothetical protein n=1 Tax=Phreatobacter sp. TaxID=1966341 RepID=UPI003F71FD18
MNRRSFFTVLAGIAAVPVVASAASAAPVTSAGSAAAAPLTPSFEPLIDDAVEMQRRRPGVVVRRPGRPRRPVVVRPRRRRRVCVRRAGVLVCR